jgi:hypothetical protein
MSPTDDARLDNPVRAALSGAQARFAQVCGHALRYPADVGPCASRLVGALINRYPAPLPTRISTHPHRQHPRDPPMRRARVLRPPPSHDLRADALLKPEPRDMARPDPSERIHRATVAGEGTAPYPADRCGGANALTDAVCSQCRADSRGCIALAKRARGRKRRTAFGFPNDVRDITHRLCPQLGCDRSGCRRRPASDRELSSGLSSRAAPAIPGA